MKLYVALLGASLGVYAAGIGDVKTVYLLPMSNALDQFLAMHLTSANVLQVVTDPKKADAILTDRIGEGLDEKLDDLYAPPKPPAPKNDAKQVEDEIVKPPVQPMSHARGTVFLIDRKTRDVLWSVYERPKSSTPDDINRIAAKISSKLSKDLKGK